MGEVVEFGLVGGNCELLASSSSSSTGWGAPEQDETRGNLTPRGKKGPGLAWALGLALDLCGGDGVGDGSLWYDHVNVDGPGLRSGRERDRQHRGRHYERV